MKDWMENESGVEENKKWTVREEYDIEPPYSAVRIFTKEEGGEYSYRVIEPVLGSKTKEVLELVRRYFVSGIKAYPLSKEERHLYIQKEVEEILRLKNLEKSLKEKEVILYYLYREFEGFGSIQVPLLDDNVEDISCDGPEIPVYVFHKRYGSIRSNITFQDEQSLDGYVSWIVQKSGKHISIADPIVDCTLPDGSRLQATLGREITKRGTSFTIRRFGGNPFTSLDLVNNKTMDIDMAIYIWFLFEKGMNAFIVGGTASGKTTTLNSGLLFIPHEKKIVSIEDTREINIPHDNWIPLVTREGYGAIDPVTNKKGGEVGMFDLLVTSLRQRPDYIVVGEVRGGEAYTVFQSMATGQTAYGTFHANDITSFVHRLEGEPINVPRAMMASLDVVIFQEQLKRGKEVIRKMRKIVEITGIDRLSGEVTTNTVFEWDQQNDRFNFSGHSYLYDRLKIQENWSSTDLEKEIERRSSFLGRLQKEGVKDYAVFSGAINLYHRSLGESINETKGRIKEGTP